MGYADVRDGLAHRLDATGEFSAVYATVPDSVIHPAAVVLPDRIAVDYHEAMGGVRLLRFDVTCLAGRYEPSAAQADVDRWMFAVPAALEADQTLDGAATSVIVQRAVDYGNVTIGTEVYTGVRFLTEVHA